MTPLLTRLQEEEGRGSGWVLGVRGDAGFNPFGGTLPGLLKEMSTAGPAVASTCG